MTRRRRQRQHHAPTPAAPPSWTPATAYTLGGWEQRAADQWRGAATALTRGIPAYEGRCIWRRRRNDALRERYGTEQMP